MHALFSYSFLVTMQNIVSDKDVTELPSNISELTHLSYSNVGAPHCSRANDESDIC